MLHLQSLTDKNWVEIAEANIEQILSDHAWCEQKAASSAISMIVKFSDFPELVTKMTALVAEEIGHFGRVHDFILKRNLKLAPERKDNYVNDLLKFLKNGGDRKSQLIDRLLIAAMIEARSCERFKVLSMNVKDSELAEFYRELMESEAAHYTMFITLARNIGKREKVDTRWRELVQFEEEIMKNYGTHGAIHG
jgi:tRNA-(ms[2]io[6]A)-hydroxylase